MKEDNKNMSRTSNSVFNASSNLIINLAKYILQFVVRTIFIKILGETYLGVGGLLTNLLQMLSIAELGLNTAIGFSLYKPLAHSDNKKVSSLMTFLKKAYYIIGIVVLFLGIILYFFLPYLIKEYDNIEQINIIYILYLFNTVSIYFISYKDVLINADQKAYKLTKINLAFTLIIAAFQIIVLLIFRNYIFYLATNFALQILQRCFVNRYITQKYNMISFNSKEKVEKESLTTIKKNIKGLMFHKIGDYCVNGTDNIIISTMININSVGYYSNYLMIMQIIQQLISTIFSNITPSFGNLLVEKNGNSCKRTFLKMDFICFSLYSFCIVVYTSVISLFIKLWIGENYVLEDITVFLLSFSYFLISMRIASYTVKSAAGIYKQDSWAPFVQAVINLVVSIVMAKFWGINGVIIGTIVSSLVPNTTRIYYIYKLVFKEKLSNYLLKYFMRYLLFYIITVLISFFACKTITWQNWGGLVAKITVSSIIYIVLFLLVFHRSTEYKETKELAKKFLKKINEKIFKRNKV